MGPSAAKAPPAGAFVDLGTFGGTRSSGWGVNDEGSVAGRSDTTGNLGRVFVWDARTATMRNLGSLEAIAINNARTVVGLKAGVGPASLGVRRRVRRVDRRGPGFT